MGNGKGASFAREDEGEWCSNGKGPMPERALPQRLCEVAAKSLIRVFDAAHPSLRRAHQRRQLTTGREALGTHPAKARALGHRPLT